jgi:hypothetical protein
MPMRAELSIPAMRSGLWQANGRIDMAPERRHTKPRMGTSADFHIACLWSAFGLTLTGLLFALGLGAQIGQILAIAG